MPIKLKTSTPRLSLAFNLKMIMFCRQLNATPSGRRTIMALNICWLDDLAKAKEAAWQTKKPVLLDFFSPQ
jgi:hypothetical protein